MLAIEGDESAERPLHTGAETGFGDNDANIDFLAQLAIAGKIIGAERTLNRMQGIALSLICEALDERTNGADRQYLQYVGGGGGTGKSWLIDTVKEVFAAKGASSRLVIMVTSGTAAVGIGVLDEQKRAEGDAYLLGFLERLREGKQIREDAAKLEAQYNSESKFDFTSGRRAVIPLNRHRWDLTLHAALAYSVDTGRKISIYLSKHKWESRIPIAEERKAAMLLGDEGKLSAAGMFPYVEGMPVVINENKYIGLKVVNGAEFTAVGILHPPGVEEIIINDRLSIFLGPPSGIIL
ncbi:DNA repair and recombination protein [Colletotrichum truncatum]|uniref:DNA repair and recombination protein n=1 Tax=Colletotrichum truncatum TaxID=5467 RepID=A0ACC3YDP8_COLTU